jgi:GH24 family phage-related lysozyme (muramidase)
MLLSERALKLIIDFEGINQPGSWPGAASGITLGYGYDLGHVTPGQFVADWGACFTAAQMARLSRAIGKTGAAARSLAASLADIRCTAADARRVLIDVSLPVYADRTRRAFPGFDVLPLDVQGALVSLVYNRGAGMKDSPGTDNRKEMRAIRDLVASGVLVGIAAEIRAMKRLWIGKGLDGLLRRREAEASLVESALIALRHALRGLRQSGRRRGVTRGRRARGGIAVAPAASRKAVVIRSPRSQPRVRRAARNRSRRRRS